jgi:TatD DNase family protein
MLVDSHCHLNMLDLTPFDNDMAKIIQQAKDNQVEYLLTVSVTLEEAPELIKLAETYPEVYCSVGEHPNEHPGKLITAQMILACAAHPKVIAIGETGLDFFRSEGDLTWQRQRYEHHIEAASFLDKPLIIHTRAAKKEALDILRHHALNLPNPPKAVMHCFTEDWDTAKTALDMGLYISFSGIVTFKSAVNLQDVAKKVPLDRILVETDAPYLAPMPHRGKPNIPGYVRHTAEFLANLRNEAFEEFCAETTNNFFRLFKVER